MAGKWTGMRVPLASLLMCALWAAGINYAMIALVPFLNMSYFYTLGCLLLLAAVTTTAFNSLLLHFQRKAALSGAEAPADTAETAAAPAEAPVMASTAKNTVAEADSISIKEPVIKEAAPAPPAENLANTGKAVPEPGIEAKAETKSETKVEIIKLPSDRKIAAPVIAEVTKPEAKAEPAVPKAEAKPEVKTEPAAPKAEAKPEIKTEPAVPKAEAKPKIKAKPAAPKAKAKPVVKAKPAVKTKPAVKPQQPDLMPHLKTLDDLLDFAFLANSRQDSKQAITAYKAALLRYADDSYAPFVVIELANIYKSQGAYKDALQAYESAFKLKAVASNSSFKDQFADSILYVSILQEVTAGTEYAGKPQDTIPKDIMLQIETLYNNKRSC
ncbi:MAG: hypothetical protein PUF95_08540 [Selenomonadaceae bacterium]|nr:hypothetical protein [Selenomonadaceae bacterium]